LISLPHLQFRDVTADRSGHLDGIRGVAGVDGVLEDPRTNDFIKWHSQLLSELSDKAVIWLVANRETY
jgi:hypothetical protein